MPLLKTKVGYNNALEREAPTSGKYHLATCIDGERLSLVVELNSSGNHSIKILS